MDRTNLLNINNLDHELDQHIQTTSTTIAAIKPEVDKELDAVKAAQNPQQDSTEKTVPNDEPQPLAAKGWGRADVSIRGAIKSKELTLENIKESLKSVEAFKELFNITSGAEPKFAQAREKFDTGWIAGEIKRLQDIAQAAATTNDLPQEEMDNAANTIMSFYDYMKQKSESEQQFEIPQNFKFPTGPAPASEKEFKQQFIDPIDPAASSSEEPTFDEGYIATGRQAAGLIDELREYQDDDAIMRFVGYYVAQRIQKTIARTRKGRGGVYQG